MDLLGELIARLVLVIGVRLALAGCLSGRRDLGRPPPGVQLPHRHLDRVLDDRATGTQLAGAVVNPKHRLLAELVQNDAQRPQRGRPWQVPAVASELDPAVALELQQNAALPGELPRGTPDPATAPRCDICRARTAPQEAREPRAET